MDLIPSMKIAYFLGNPVSEAWPHFKPTDVPSHLASHRLRSAIPARELMAAGHEITVMSSPQDWLVGSEACHAARLIISKLSHPSPAELSKLMHAAAEQITEARKHGVVVLVDYSDDIVARGDHRSGPTLQLLLQADCVVCASEELARRVRLYLGTAADVRVIPDPVEGERRDPQIPEPTAVHPLHLLWFGHISNLDVLLNSMDVLRDAAQHIPLRLEILTSIPTEQLLELQIGLLGASLPFAVDFTEWQGPDSLNEALTRSDVAFLPVDLQGPKAAASNNRLTEAFWGGCFVVASPVPSFANFADLAWLGSDFDEALAWVAGHPDAVMVRVRQAQDRIALHYTAEKVGSEWEKTLASVREMHSIESCGFHEGPRLNLGCGNHPLDGYLNIDVLCKRAGVRPDLVCDIRKLSIFPCNFAQEILSVHVVEHFHRWEIEKVLQEWIRVLRPGGRLIIECPNLLSACRALLQDPTGAAASGAEGRSTMWVLYGDPAWEDPLMCHRWGYTPGSLTDLLLQCGLEDARQEPAQFKMREPRDMRITARKPYA